jgi:apolipoprotein N-acyltransferase
VLNRLPPRRVLLLRVLLAIAAGGVLGLAYEPYDLPWLLLVAVPALLFALRGTSMRAGALVGAAFGITWYAVLVPWLSVIGGDAAIALAVLEGLFYGVFGALAGPVMRIRGWQVWVPALWVATEYATASVPFGGFPWGRLAWAVAGSEPGHFAAWLGIPGLSFLLALLGTLVYAAVRPGAGSLLRRVVPAAFVVVVLGVAFAVPTPDTDGGRDVTVAMVQGNVPGKGMDFLGEARTVTRNHLAATEQLAADVAAGRQPKPDLVIWPENSTDIDPFQDAETRSDIEAAVAAVNVPVLVGAVLDGPGPNERQTTGVVWDPRTGPGQIYAKRHPVPFGEYIPFRDQLLPYIKRLEQVGRQTAPGTAPGVLPIGGVTYGDVICFEIAYDDVVADVMEGGAQILVVQTNNATYTGTGQPDQQFAITRLRAIETGRTVLVASTNGISGVIHPDGRIEHKSAQGVRDVYVTKVPVRDGTTLATKLGPWPQWILTALGLAGVVLALVRRRRLRSSRRPAPPAPPGEHDGHDEREPVAATATQTGSESDR